MSHVIINIFWWRNYFKNWVAFWKFPLCSQACKPWDPCAVHPGPFPAHRDKVDRCTPACAPQGVSPAPPAGILPRCAEGWDPLAPADGCGTNKACVPGNTHCTLQAFCRAFMQPAPNLSWTVLQNVCAICIPLYTCQFTAS